MSNVFEFSDAITVTKSDSTDLTSFGLRGLYVGTTGDVTLVTTKNESVAVKFTAVPAGVTLHLPIKKVMATGTSAGALVGLVGT